MQYCIMQKCIIRNAQQYLLKKRPFRHLPKNSFCVTCAEILHLYHSNPISNYEKYIIRFNTAVCSTG